MLICVAACSQKGNPVSKQNNSVNELMYTCPRCEGSGNCRVCGGSGTYTSPNGEVRGCAVCKKDPGVCQTCKGSGEVMENTFNRSITNDNTVKNKNNDTEKYLCSWCKGSGICKECGGSGKNDATSQVLKAMGCTLCEGSGKCAKCGGDGIAIY